MAVKKPALVVAILLLLISCGQRQRPQPVAVKGVLDLTNWDLEKDGPVELNGQWEFYWKKLVAPQELQSKNPPRPDGFIKVPGTWNDFIVDGKKIGEDGYATYRLTVITGPQKERLGLKIRDIESAYRLFVNGTMISTVGRVGTSKEEEFGSNKNQVVSFNRSNNRYDIIFHVSNHVSTVGGIGRRIGLGRESDCINSREMTLLFEFSSVGILAIMFLYHFIIFLLRKNERIPLYFSLMCIFIALNFLTRGERYIYTILSGLELRQFLILAYSGMIFNVVFFTMYFYEMYKDELSRKAIFLLQLCFSSILLGIIIFPSKIQLILGDTIVHIPADIGLLYALYVTIRMVLKKRIGSLLFLLALSAIFIFGFLEVLWKKEIIQLEFRFYYGMMVFVLIQAYALAKRYSEAFDENLTLKNGLELKVENRTKELASALEEVETINERLTESNAKLEGFGATLRRYLPMQLVDSIISGGKVSGSHTERRKLTVFFSDIKAFTDTTDSLEAEELSSLLNEYLTEMTRIATGHGGTIDKFVGDAIMIFFGAPESKGEKEDALRCLRMAAEMQARMKELQKKWFEQGIENPLQIRIGINTGVATVGDFGAQERLSYTAIGGQVNLASRLESLCEPGRILISHSTWALVKEEFTCAPKGKVQVKGIHHDVLVYEVAAG